MIANPLRGYPVAWLHAIVNLASQLADYDVTSVYFTYDKPIVRDPASTPSIMIVNWGLGTSISG